MAWGKGSGLGKGMVLGKGSDRGIGQGLVELKKGNGVALGEEKWSGGGAVVWGRGRCLEEGRGQRREAVVWAQS